MQFIDGGRVRNHLACAEFGVVRPIVVCGRRRNEQRGEEQGREGAVGGFTQRGKEEQLTGGSTGSRPATDDGVRGRKRRRKRRTGEAEHREEEEEERKRAWGGVHACVDKIRLSFFFNYIIFQNFNLLY